MIFILFELDNKNKIKKTMKGVQTTLIIFLAFCIGSIVEARVCGVGRSWNGEQCGMFYENLNIINI